MIGPRVNGLPAPDWASGQLSGDVDASWFVSAVLGQVVGLFLGSVSVVFYFLPPSIPFFIGSGRPKVCALDVS